MNWVEAIILGLVQGLTEFLPVSSSGHLEIARSLFGTGIETGLYFTITVHGATVLSTIVVLWEEILKLLKGSLKFRMNEETNYLFKIIISMIPVGLTGFLFKDKIEQLFSGNVTFVGLMLLVTSFMLLMGHIVKKNNRNIGYLDAFIIGIAQAVAVIPGISRSGATIATGLMLGNKKEELAKFSFLMVIIPVIGANIVEVLSGNVVSGYSGIMILLAGFISAFIAGYLACKWMIVLVKKSKMIWFSLYCAVAGLVAILLG
jgi:undecaprenyl-diphosphatase